MKYSRKITIGLFIGLLMIVSVVLIIILLKPVNKTPKAGLECVDICEAICAGESEPDNPQACPIPMCVCDESTI